MSLDALIRLQARYNDEERQGVQRLGQNIGEILQQRGMQDFEKNAMNILRDGATPEKLEQISAMYPRMPKQEIWKFGAAVGKQKDAQNAKDVMATITSAISNGQELTPQLIAKASEGKGFAPEKMMKLLQGMSQAGLNFKDLAKVDKPDTPGAKTLKGFDAQGKAVYQTKGGLAYNEGQPYGGGQLQSVTQKEGTQKAGQNWILPDRRTVISYDGGRTYKTSTGAAEEIPQGSVKVPGGATLNELNLNEARKQAQRELDESASPTTQSPKLAALEGTGPYKSLASAFEAVAGGFGIDTLVGQIGFFPETADAKQYLRSVKQMGKAALMNSARGAIWEQERIDKLFPDPDKLFTNPRIEARKFKNLMEIIEKEKRFNNESILTALPAEVAKYRTANNEIDRLISLIAEPSSVGIADADAALIRKYLKGK